MKKENYSNRIIKHINFDVLNDELLYSLKKCNIHLLREEGLKIGVKSVTTHSKDKLIELILEKLREQDDGEMNSASSSFLSQEDINFLTCQKEFGDEFMGEMSSGVLEVIGREGFLRKRIDSISNDDVYVLAGIIDEHELCSGDFIVGKSVEIGERGMTALTSIVSINGKSPNLFKRIPFGKMLCTQANVRIDRVQRARLGDDIEKADNESISMFSIGNSGRDATNEGRVDVYESITEARGRILDSTEEEKRGKEGIGNEERGDLREDGEFVAEYDSESLTICRMMDIFSPLARGQRNLVLSYVPMDMSALISLTVRSLMQEGIETHVIAFGERAETVQLLHQQLAENLVVLDESIDEEEVRRILSLVVENKKRAVEAGRNAAIIVTNLLALRSWEIQKNQQNTICDLPKQSQDTSKLYMETDEEEYGQHDEEKRQFSLKSMLGIGRQIKAGGSLTVVGYSLVLGAVAREMCEELIPIANSLSVITSSGKASKRFRYNPHESYSDYFATNKEDKAVYQKTAEFLDSKDNNYKDEEIIAYYEQIRSEELKIRMEK